MQQNNSTLRKDERIIIHFDYDCFYASVVENENPALKSVPLAIQQKQIVVTCNYEARRRGLRKLQLITEAKKVCPEAVIVLGEDLTRFRNASKRLYAFLKQSIWSDRAEKLGFDEVWYEISRNLLADCAHVLNRLDCTDMIDFNVALLNKHNLAHSFFCLDENDPTVGFEFNALAVYGPTLPTDTPLSELAVKANHLDTPSHIRLVLGSHLARHMRHELECQLGYTATVGIAQNKLLAKLVGNVNKPHNQTTLIPVTKIGSGDDGSVLTFMDSHDIGKVPGIGFKLAQKIRGRVLGRPPFVDQELSYPNTKDTVTVREVRLFPGMSPELLEEILGGPGSQKGIGGKIWGLINGSDESEVARAKRVPSQISQEDSYMKYLHTFEDVKRQLHTLAKRLIERMHIDLLEEDDAEDDSLQPFRWLAHPRTLRLSTRPRPPLNADGTRSRAFQRISRSSPMPNFAFNLREEVDSIVDRLVDDVLVPMFRKLHPEKTGWNLSLINIAVTNMAETAADTKDSEGRDISRMFRRQDDVLKDYKVQEGQRSSPDPSVTSVARFGDLEATPGPDTPCERSSPSEWMADEDNDEEMYPCAICGTPVPIFAASAHERYHRITA